MNHATIFCLLFSLSITLAFESDQSRQKRWPWSKEPDEKCFGILGCFVKKFFTDPHRDEPYLPQPLEEIKTRFIVYTRENKPKSGTTKLINYGDKTTASSSGFKSNNPVTIIIHGFKASGQSDWVLDITKNILTQKDVNVIVVDWENGATGGDYWLPYKKYKQAVANTWVVGQQTSKLCEFLQKNLGVKYEDIHLIGHSLGSHICGYTGANLTGQIGRISGLDPAEPEYQNTDKRIRLDPTDAKYVDVIHTDARSYITVTGYGMKQAVGHVDFYPNGGEVQPGCRLKRNEDLEENQSRSKRGEFFDSILACRHGRAYKYYNYSFTPSSCSFVAHECTDYGSYIRGKCNSCGEDGSKCLKMGYYANEGNKTQPENRKFYVITSDSAPYCVHQYSIELILNKQPIKYGEIDFILYGNGKTHAFSMEVKEGNFIKQVIGSPNDLGQIKKLELLCLPPGWILNRSRKLCEANGLQIKEIRVEAMDIQNEKDRVAATTVLCPEKQEAIKVNTMVKFKDNYCKKN